MRQVEKQTSLQWKIECNVVMYWLVNLFLQLFVVFSSYRSLRELSLEGNRIRAIPTGLLRMNLNHLNITSNFVAKVFWKETCPVLVQVWILSLYVYLCVFLCVSWIKNLTEFKKKTASFYSVSDFNFNFKKTEMLKTTCSLKCSCVSSTTTTF